MLRYLPLGLDTRRRKVLVVGAGKVALQKVQVLLTTEARVTVVAPEAHEDIIRLASQKRLKLYRREYCVADVKGVMLVISATNDNKLNRQIYADAHKLGILVNVVDVPELCDLIFMSVTQRHKFVVALSTDGRQPGKTKKLRHFLEARIDEYRNKGKKFWPCAEQCPPSGCPECRKVLKVKQARKKKISSK